MCRQINFLSRTILAIEVKFSLCLTISKKDIDDDTILKGTSNIIKIKESETIFGLVLDFFEIHQSGTLDTMHHGPDLVFEKGTAQCLSLGLVLWVS